MNSFPWKLFALFVLGISAPIWWTWTVSKLIYAFYVMSGSPDKPTVAHLWGTVYAPSFLFGIMVGLVIVFLSTPNPIKGWGLFMIGLVIGEVMISFVFNLQIEILLLAFVLSTGNLFFFAGSALVSGIFAIQERNKI